MHYLKIFLVVSMLFVTNICFSQVKCYPKIGMNYSFLGNIDYPPVPIESDWIVSPNLGVGLSFGVSNSFSINTELLWNVKGGKNTFDSSEGIRIRTYRYSYLSLPIYSKIKLKKIGILFGIEPSYFVRGSIYLGDRERPTTLRYSPSRPYKNFDFGFLTGLSFKINEKLFMDLRYTHGLNIVYIYIPHRVNGDVFEDGVEYNRVLSLSVGYYLFSS